MTLSFRTDRRESELTVKQAYDKQKQKLHGQDKHLVKHLTGIDS
jgi:hypothetical protein